MANWFLGTITPPGNFLAAPAALGREKRHKSPDVIHGVTPVYGRTGSYSPIQERQGYFLAASLHTLLWGGANSHVPRAELMQSGEWVPMPVSLFCACSCHCHRYWMAPGRCQTTAVPRCRLVPGQELIRGCHGRHRLRQHRGRLFAHWAPATPLSFSAPAPQHGKNRVKEPSGAPTPIGLLKWRNQGRASVSSRAERE